MKVIFWGTPEFAIPCLNAINDSEHELVAVVTQPDKRRGRGKRKEPSAIKKRALEIGLKVFTPKSIKKELDVQEEIDTIKADIFIVVAFGQILPEIILNMPPLGCWNCHASLLPRWRGAGPIQWSLLSGDKHTGVTIMAMEKELDTGAILLSAETTIGLLDNYNELSLRLSNLSSILLMQAIDKIRSHIMVEKSKMCKILNLTKQSEMAEAITYARLIKKQDYIINWNASSIEIHRKIMGLYPNSYTYWKGKRFKITRSIPLSELFMSEMNDNLKLIHQRLGSTRGNPGEVIYFQNNLGIIISTSDYNILIIEGKLEGKATCSKNTLIQQINPSKGDLFDNNKSII